MTTKGWMIEHISKVPPKRSNFMKGYKSVRWHMGITAFGVNAVTVDKGDWLTYEHDESKTNQEELFVILDGEAEFKLDGETVITPVGSLIAIKPGIVRSAKALQTPTTMLIVGAPIGATYKPAGWA